MVARSQSYERYVPAKPRILICEGRDEEVFFLAILAHLGIGDIQPLPIGGKTQLRNSLRWLKTRSEFRDVRSLGILRDADEDAAAAFSSVTSALETEGLPVPAQPLTPTPEQPKVTVMILPGDEQPGALEDLCLRTVSDSPALFCVDDYVRCLRNRLSNYDPTPGNLGKARVHALLASKEDPDLRLGEAAQKGLWDFDHPAFTKVRQFLSNI